jgi:CelD/BcsL family acetyltransferase involved in cellulose biosynthesis
MVSPIGPASCKGGTCKLQRLLDAGLPDSPAFREAAASLAADDKLRAFLLFDGEKPVSYLYCPVEDGIVVYAYLGYDPGYARLSVGTVLQWLALQSLFEERKFRLFDFTEGQSEHKRFFATHERECANVFWLTDTLGNRILVRAHEAMNRFSTWLGGKLDELGLKAKIKRLMRRN